MRFEVDDDDKIDEEKVIKCGWWSVYNQGKRKKKLKKMTNNFK